MRVFQSFLLYLSNIRADKNSQQECKTCGTLYTYKESITHLLSIYSKIVIYKIQKLSTKWTKCNVHTSYMIQVQIMQPNLIWNIKTISHAKIFKCQMLPVLLSYCTYNLTFSSIQSKLSFIFETCNHVFWGRGNAVNV